MSKNSNLIPSPDKKFFQIVNDTVGTLMAHAYRDPSTFMGIIFGTGTNAGT